MAVAEEVEHIVLWLAVFAEHLQHAKIATAVEIPTAEAFFGLSFAVVVMPIYVNIRPRRQRLPLDHWLISAQGIIQPRRLRLRYCLGWRWSRGATGQNGKDNGEGNGDSKARKGLRRNSP